MIKAIKQNTADSLIIGQNGKIYQKIVNLINDILRQPFTGIGRTVIF